MNKYELHTSAGDLVVLETNLSNTSITPIESAELKRLNDEQLVYLLPSIIYTSLLMLIGTPGNGIVLYVYFFKWRKSTSRMFILFLAGLDFLNCLTTLPIEIFIMRYSLMLDKPWLCKISRFATYTMNSASAAILVAIAVDRFKRICKPHGNQIRAKTSKYICIGCILFALTLTWPALVFYGTRYINLGSVVGKACLLENKFDRSSYPYIYFVIMMGSTVVIFAILSILYYFVGLQIYRHRQSQKKRRRATLVEKSSTKSNSANLLKGTDSDDLRQAAEGMNGLINHGEIPLNDENTNTSNVANSREHDPVEIDQELTSTYVQGYRDRENEVVHKPQESCKDKTQSETEDNKEHNSIPLQLLEKSESSKRRRKNNRLFKRNALLQSSSIRHNNTGCMNLKLRIGRSTLMLFLITLAYIISFLPYYTLAIIRQSYSSFVVQLSEGGYMAYHLFLRSYQLSSAINPIIYSFCNAQFRCFILDLFRRETRAS